MRKPLAQRSNQAKLETRSGRAALPARSTPYWMTVANGISLGYLTGKGGGSWFSRLRLPGRKQQIHKMGLVDDVREADGSRILNFTQALELARRSARKQPRKKNGMRKPSTYTVLDAMRDYLQFTGQRGDRSQLGQTRVVEHHFATTLGPIAVEKLTRDDVRQWRQTYIEHRTRLGFRRGLPVRYEKIPETAEELRRRHQSANRALATLKTALNYALSEGHVECTGAAWREVKMFPYVQADRCRFLSDDEQRMLVAACDGEFRWLVIGALYTGARFGELTHLRIENLTGERVFIPAEISKNKKARNIVLESSGQKFFAALAAGRPQEELIFMNGKRPWQKSEQWSHTQIATGRAEIEDFSFRDLRHTAASNWVRAGIPIKYVADQLGHGVLVCERYYAHITPDHRAEVFAKLPPGRFTDAEEIQHIRESRNRSKPDAEMKGKTRRLPAAWRR
jgi:integrase